MASEREDIEVVRIPILGVGTNRSTDSSKDQRFVNGYFDLLRNEVTGKASYYFVKRPGLEEYIHPVGSAATARGMTSWRGEVYSVYTDKIYSGTTDLGVTLTTTTGLCSFAAARASLTSTECLVMTDGQRLYRISTTDVVTTVTTIPVNTGQIVYFDGIFWVLGTDGSIYNSTIDDPTDWPVINFITPIMENGSPVTIARQGDFIIVFQNNAFQGYFNNANPVGPPIENYPQVMKQIGCSSKNSLDSSETLLFWVGSGQTGGQSVWQMDSPGQVKEISSPALDRILNAEEANISTCNGKFIRTCGHSFYVLKLSIDGEGNRTFVYDVDLQIWMEWESSTGGSSFPITTFAQHNNILIAQHTTNGKIYNMLPTVYQDDVSDFTVLARFARFDADTNLPKFVKSVALNGDIQSSTTNVDLQYSDDDYNTLSTARTLDMSLSYPYTTAMGSFRRRSYQISYEGSNPFRVESLELRYRLGEV